MIVTHSVSDTVIVTLSVSDTVIVTLSDSPSFSVLEWGILSVELWCCHCFDIARPTNSRSGCPLAALQLNT